MRAFLAACGLLLLAATSSQADQLFGAMTAAPYLYSPSATANSDQHNLAITSATSLIVPADALFANVCTRGGAANYQWDGGTPTGSSGNPLTQGQCVQFAGRNIITKLQFIQQTGNTTTLDVAYSK